MYDFRESLRRHRIKATKYFHFFRFKYEWVGKSIFFLSRDMNDSHFRGSFWKLSLVSRIIIEYLKSLTCFSHILLYWLIYSSFWPIFLSNCLPMSREIEDTKSKNYRHWFDNFFSLFWFIIDVISEIRGRGSQKMLISQSQLKWNDFFPSLQLFFPCRRRRWQRIWIDFQRSEHFLIKIS